MFIEHRTQLFNTILSFFIPQPTHLEVINESNMHNVPKGSESHFKVVVVSMDFENLSLIKRHRMVNDVLKDELAGGVHALSIQVGGVKLVLSGPLTLRLGDREIWPQSISKIRNSCTCCATISGKFPHPELWSDP